MRTLETGRLIIRAFRLEDGATYSRLLDEAFGAESYGTPDAKRVMFEYQVAADAGLALLHQPPYGDRAIVLRSSGAIVGSVGFAPCLMPFGQLPSFEPSTLFTSEVGLFWALFPDQQDHGYATEAAAAMVAYAFAQLHLRRIVATTEHDNTRSINVMRRLGMRIERNPRPEPAWLQTVGILDNAN
ncbi:MAG TPA: GNAT family protein [Candidatus Limnocylindria bacterium]|nr:GNAT family protein [Candidatus Limnocylindria bacterium]